VCLLQTVFDELEGFEMRKARTRSNPYELIKGAIFLNRAAMKMANMDHRFDFMFTSPKVGHCIRHSAYVLFHIPTASAVKLVLLFRHLRTNSTKFVDVQKVTFNFRLMRSHVGLRQGLKTS